MTARSGQIEIVLRDLIREVVEEVLAERGAGDKLLTVAAAAELASVSPDTIREWIATGRLKAAGRAGRRYRVRAGDVAAAIARSAPAAPRRRSGPTPEDLAERDVREILAGRRRSASTRRKP